MNPYGMAGQIGGFVFEQTLEHTLIAELEKYGWHVYNEKFITDNFGKDITGVTICCKYENFIVAIQCRDSKKPYMISCLKDMTHFIYSSAIIKAKEGIPIHNIWVCAQAPSVDAMDAVARKNINIVQDVNEQTLMAKVIEKIGELYQQHIRGMVLPIQMEN